MTEKIRGARRERGIKKLPNGKWRYSWTFRGRYHRMTAPTYAIATACLAKIRAEIAEGRYLDKDPSQTTLFEDVVTEFLKWSALNVAPGTHRRDKEFAARWLAFPKFKGRVLADITAADVEAYRNARLGSTKTRKKGRYTFETRPAGKATCDNDLARLRRLFNLAKAWKMTRENPAAGVKFFRPDNKRYRFVTPDEEALIVASCPPDVRPAVALAVNTGIRQGELVTLTWGQVDIPRKTLTLTAEKTKGKKTRHIPLNAAALAALKSLPRGISPTSPVFAVVAGRDQRDLVRRFERAVKATSINDGVEPAQRVTWHTLRHTFASRLVQRGVSLLTVKELLGHSTLAMVMRYAHLADENLRSAVDSLATAPNLHETCTAACGPSAEGGQ